MKKKCLVWVNLLLLPLAAVSLYAGIRNALRPGRSQDFQWSGTSLVLHHSDPYHQFLIHDPAHLILMSQVPNYLHELYLLLLPFGMMSFATAKIFWLIANCIFMIAALFLLRRIYALEPLKTSLVALLLFGSTPFRMTLGCGTESMLELLLFCLVFSLSGPIRRGLVLGLSYMKYSFSPVLFLYFLFRRKYRMLAASFLPPLIGLLGVWAFVHGELIHLAVEPFAVSRTGVQPGLGDLMLMIRIALHGVLPTASLFLLGEILAALASAGLAWFYAAEGDISRGKQAALLSVASLLLFTHLTYDYVFLIVAAAACLEGAMNRIKILILSAISIILYGVKLQGHLGISPTNLGIATFLLLSVILVLLARPEFAESTNAHFDAVAA